MAGIKITGGIPLSGEVKIQGSKNAALPMMAAALLNKGVTVLHGCPKIADVFVMEEILKKLGVKVIWEGHTLLLDAEQVCKVRTLTPESTATSFMVLKTSSPICCVSLILSYIITLCEGQWFLIS